MGEKQKLVIDRSKWLRGEGYSVSQLHRERDGKMCCLGFFGLACGIALERLTGCGDPQDTNARGQWPEWLFDSNAVGNLITANDEQRFTQSEREARISAIFAKHGVAVEFV